MTKVTEVAAAVIERPDGTFLLAQRPEGKVYPGFWEFPGGKIEPGEDARAALVRELEEELGIRVTAATPWITRVYAYTHATVRLHFYRVTAWDGEPRPLEDQAIAWQRPGATSVAPMLPANAPVLSALELPELMLVSNAAELGIDGWVMRLAARSLEERVVVQVREKAAGRLQVQHLLQRVLARCAAFGSIVVVNSDCGRFAQAAGVHLTSRALMAAVERPAGRWVGASAHDEAEMAQVERLGLDYAVVGPVKPTPSHPGAIALGWERFEALIRGRSVPSYAIGGLARSDLPEAKRRGAQGVALRSAAFD